MKKNYKFIKNKKNKKISRIFTGEFKNIKWLQRELKVKNGVFWDKKTPKNAIFRNLISHFPAAQFYPSAPPTRDYGSQQGRIAPVRGLVA